jgi:poly(3-hydroxybutyrate) depolymerase
MTLLMLLTAAPSFCSGVARRKASCDGASYSYLLFSPDDTKELPALLLLHGAGDSPDPMVRVWESMAKKEGIVLIAPELPGKLEFEDKAPRVFECVVENAKHSAKIDAKQVYVFGNSMGGYLAYDAMAFDSRYFAAVAVHAMGIDPSYDGILKHATRKVPVAIYMGDEDPLVSLKNVRRTRDLLAKNGFAVHYVELKGHDHNYYRIAEKINPDVWQFLRENRLP